MNNDNFSINNYNSDNLKYDEFEILNNKEIDSESIFLTQRPPRRPERPEPPQRRRPDRPERPEPPQRPEPPSDRRPPMIPPPLIIPQLPRGVVIPPPGTAEFNTQYRDLNRINNIGWQFRYCLNRFTFIWLWDGRTFWFYPTVIGWRSAEGFIWYRDRWYYYRLDLNNIFFYRCF